MAPLPLRPLRLPETPSQKVNRPPGRAFRSIFDGEPIREFKSALAESFATIPVGTLEHRTIWYHDPKAIVYPNTRRIDIFNFAAGIFDSYGLGQPFSEDLYWGSRDYILI